MASKPKHPRGPKSGHHEDKGPPRQPPKPATAQRRPGNVKSAHGRNARPLCSEQERQSPLHHASSSHNGSPGLKGASPKYKPENSKARGPRRKPQKNVSNKDRSWELRLHILKRSDIIVLSQLRGNELVTKLFNSLKTFQQTLQHQETLTTPGIMDAILQIVLSLTEVLQCQLQSSGEISQQAGQILAEILSSRCDRFHFQLKQFVINLKIYSTVAQLSSNAFRFERLCHVFETLLVILPSCSWSCLPIDELFDTVKQLSTSSTDSAKLVTKTLEIVELRNQMKQQFIPKQHNKSLSQEYPAEEWDNSQYRQIRILPKWEEICTSDPPAKLRPNIVDGAYTDWMHYYDIQFRLLREDFIAPLRRGVCEYMQGTRGRKLKDVKVYHNVRIVKPVFTFAGTCFSLHFDVSHLQRCNWMHSKRLIFGSLVCLSPDEFHHIIIFATIANREPPLLAKGIVEVLFEEGARILPFCQKDTCFTMVESNAYFEASCHILHSLQTAEVETMPFTRYLIQNECTSISPPQYLADHADSAHYNLTCLYGSQSSSVFQDQHSAQIGIRGLKLTGSLSLPQHSPINILERSQWPNNDKIELDQSQLEAIQMALTQEIAVIQGPPGTGKTYIGLKIVEALLNNRQRWDHEEKSPIVVMCFTNHALDQFLEGILKNHILHTSPHKDRRRRLAGIHTRAPKIVRIGGRSQSELIKPLNISNVKKSVFLPQEVRNQLHRLKEDLIKNSKSSILWQKLSRCYDNRSFPSLNDLYQWIDPDHYYQILYQAQSPEQWDYALEIWLGLMEVIEILPAESEANVSEANVSEANASEANVSEANVSAQKEFLSTSTDPTSHPKLPEVAPIMVTLAQAEPQQYNQILRDYVCQQVKALHPDFADEITDNLLKNEDVLHMLQMPDLLKMKAQEIATVLQEQLIDIQGEAEVEEASRILENEQEDLSCLMKHQKHLDLLRQNLMKKMQKCMSKI